MRPITVITFVSTVIIGFIIASVVYFYIDGDGYFSFFLININRHVLAEVLAVISFGVYIRYSKVIIPPNQQGVLTLFGFQIGQVLFEGNLHLVPFLIMQVWKIVSVEHFTFTVAAQNRTKEGFTMMVFATGRAIPENAFLIAKMSSMDYLKEQLLGLSMMTIGRYINVNERMTLLNYPVWDISRDLRASLEEEREQHGVMEIDGLYGVKVILRTSKVIEVDKVTEAQFNMVARAIDMTSAIENMKKLFPSLSDVELYAMYATLVGITPSVMSYIVHGEGNKNIFVGGVGGNNHQ